MLRMRNRNTSSSNGLHKYSSTPISKLFFCWASDVNAVSIRNGMCDVAKFSFTRADNSIPSITGIIRSLTIKSTACFCMICKAASPFSASSN